jgi:cytochrome c
MPRISRIIRKSAGVAWVDRGFGMSAGSSSFNNYAMAILGAVTLTMALNLFSGALVSPHKAEKPGWDLPAEQAAAPAGGGAAAAAAVAPIAERLKTADAAKGQGLTKQCASCHTFDTGGKTLTGPNLHGVVGKAAGSVAGFAYSDKMKGLGKPWDADLLDQFLANPKGVVPGTKMSFAGISKPEQRADLIKYLESLK